MEIIKKTVLQAVTTGTTVSCTFRDPETGELITGCTGTCYIIVPDLTAVYNFKIGLTAVMDDIGFFDAYVPETAEEIEEVVIPEEDVKYYAVDYDTTKFINHNDEKLIII